MVFNGAKPKEANKTMAQVAAFILCLKDIETPQVISTPCYSQNLRYCDVLTVDGAFIEVNVGECKSGCGYVALNKLLLALVSGKERSHNSSAKESEKEYWKVTSDQVERRH